MTDNRDEKVGLSAPHLHLDNACLKQLECMMKRQITFEQYKVMITHKDFLE